MCWCRRPVVHWTVGSLDRQTTIHSQDHAARPIAHDGLFLHPTTGPDSVWWDLLPGFAATERTGSKAFERWPCHSSDRMRACTSQYSLWPNHLTLGKMALGCMGGLGFEHACYGTANPAAHIDFRRGHGLHLLGPWPWPRRTPGRTQLRRAGIGHGRRRSKRDCLVRIHARTGPLLGRRHWRRCVSKSISYLSVGRGLTDCHRHNCGIIHHGARVFAGDVCSTNSCDAGLQQSLSVNVRGHDWDQWAWLYPRFHATQRFSGQDTCISAWVTRKREELERKYMSDYLLIPAWDTSGVRNEWLTQARLQGRVCTSWPYRHSRDTGSLILIRLSGMLYDWWARWTDIGGWVRGCWFPNVTEALPAHLSGI